MELIIGLSWYCRDSGGGLHPIWQVGLIEPIGPDWQKQSGCLIGAIGKSNLAV